MKTQIKTNIQLVVILAITVVLLVYSLLTIWVGFNLALLGAEAVEYANQYTEIQAAREAMFYNSANPYINWLSNLSNNLIRIPVSLLVIASPVLFILAVRTYNLNKRKKARK